MRTNRLALIMDAERQRRKRVASQTEKRFDATTAMLQEMAEIDEIESLVLLAYRKGCSHSSEV